MLVVVYTIVYYDGKPITFSQALTKALDAADQTSLKVILSIPLRYFVFL
jgi:hypothetical protein